MKITITNDDGEVFESDGFSSFILEALLQDAGLIEDNQSLRILNKEEQYVLDKAF